MKTLLITENFPPKAGGSGRWFWELYSRLPVEQFQVLAGQDSQAVEFDEKASMVINRDELTSVEWGLASVIGFKFYVRQFFRIRRLIKTEKITELHCGRVLPEGVIAWLLNLFTGIPYVCYVHGEDLETAKSSREQHMMCGQVIKRAKTIICNSQNSARIVAEFGPEAEAKTQVLHPGVDSNLFIPTEKNDQVLANLGWQGKRVVLTVGRLQARKGQDMMIRAVPEIIKTVPNFLYAIVGGGDQKQALLDLVKELKVEPHVQFLSEISDQEMIECYQQCDLFILPNRTIGQDIEGFGMVLVEAQSCGKPVIAGDSGGTKETMQVDNTGIIIDATNSANISQAVSGLLQDDEKLLEMGRQAREHVKTSLDWQAHIQYAKAIFDTRTLL